MGVAQGREVKDSKSGHTYNREAATRTQQVSGWGAGGLRNERDNPLRAA